MGKGMNLSREFLDTVISDSSKILLEIYRIDENKAPLIQEESLFKCEKTYEGISGPSTVEGIKEIISSEGRMKYEEKKEFTLSEKGRNRFRGDIIILKEFYELSIKVKVLQISSIRRLQPDLELCLGIYHLYYNRKRGTGRFVYDPVNCSYYLSCLLSGLSIYDLLSLGAMGQDERNKLTNSMPTFMRILGGNINIFTACFYVGRYLDRRAKIKGEDISPEKSKEIEFILFVQLSNKAMFEYPASLRAEACLRIVLGETMNIWSEDYILVVERATNIIISEYQIHVSESTYRGGNVISTEIITIIPGEYIDIMGKYKLITGSGSPRLTHDQILKTEKKLKEIKSYQKSYNSKLGRKTSLLDNWKPEGDDVSLESATTSINPPLEITIKRESFHEILSNALPEYEFGTGRGKLYINDISSNQKQTAFKELVRVTKDVHSLGLSLVELGEDTIDVMATGGFFVSDLGYCTLASIRDIGNDQVPEYYDKELTRNQKIDIWQLGLLYYAILSGCRLRSLPSYQKKRYLKHISGYKVYEEFSHDNARQIIRENEICRLCLKYLPEDRITAKDLYTKLTQSFVPQHDKSKKTRHTTKLKTQNKTQGKHYLRKFIMGNADINPEFNSPKLTRVSVNFQGREDELRIMFKEVVREVEYVHSLGYILGRLTVSTDGEHVYLNARTASKDPSRVILRLKNTPEVCDSIKVTQKVDIWNLGVFLYEKRYSRFVMPGVDRCESIKYATHQETPRDLKYENEVTVKNLAPRIKRRIKRDPVLNSCLKYNPEDRPSAEELLRLIEKNWGI